MKIHVADAALLNSLLNRKRRHGETPFEVDLGVILKEILTWANRLVPSESGSILLDEPLLKWNERNEEKLYFAACFGKTSSSLVGTAIPDKWGIAGETYRTGKSHISRDVREDTRFYSRIDDKTGYRTKSIICAPIRIDSANIGLIELLNRRGRISYDRRELALLEIFAGYTATLIQNALIARSFEELSRRDSLTGLYNDRYFFHCLEQKVEGITRDGGCIALLFFDLDRFKEVNDSHGHLAGSRALVEIADILRTIFRRKDAVLARYGGDEYVVALPDTDCGAALPYAEILRKTIAGHTFLKKKGAPGEAALRIKGVITCSIGVSSIEGRSCGRGSRRQTAEALIRSADSAMYRAKESGKNRICVSERSCS